MSTIVPGLLSMNSCCVDEMAGALYLPFTLFVCTLTRHLRVFVLVL